MNNALMQTGISSPTTVRYFASMHPDTPSHQQVKRYITSFHFLEALPRKLTVNPQKDTLKLCKNMCNICVKP